MKDFVLTRVICSASARPFPPFLLGMVDSMAGRRFFQQPVSPGLRSTKRLTAYILSLPRNIGSEIIDSLFRDSNWDCRIFVANAAVLLDLRSSRSIIEAHWARVSVRWCRDANTDGEMPPTVETSL